MSSVLRQPTETNHPRCQLPLHYCAIHFRSFTTGRPDGTFSSRHKEWLTFAGDMTTRVSFFIRFFAANRSRICSRTHCTAHYPLLPQPISVSPCYLSITFIVLGMPSNGKLARPFHEHPINWACYRTQLFLSKVTFYAMNTGALTLFVRCYSVNMIRY